MLSDVSCGSGRRGPSERQQGHSIIRFSVQFERFITPSMIYQTYPMPVPHCHCHRTLFSRLYVFHLYHQLGGSPSNFRHFRAKWNNQRMPPQGMSSRRDSQVSMAHITQRRIESRQAELESRPTPIPCISSLHIVKPRSQEACRKR